MESLNQNITHSNYRDWTRQPLRNQRIINYPQTVPVSVVHFSNCPMPPCTCRASSAAFDKHCYSPDSAHYTNANINQKYWHMFPVVAAP